jgi:uncharacterized protein YacL
MVCIQSCMVASILFFSIFATGMTCMTSETHKKFNDMLNETQKAKYSDIVKERTYIFLIGLVVGVLVAGLFLRMLNLERRVNKNCLFVAIAITLNIVIYMVYPKSDYMLLHLEGKEQVQAWLDIYKEMKLKKFIGMGIGFFAYYIMGDGLLC